MAKDDETIQQWGYSRKDAQIFALKPGESLPNGYYDNPAKVPGSDAQKQYIADAEAEGAVIPPDFQPKRPPPVNKADQ